MTGRKLIVAAALALAGCGSSEEADKTAPFVGPWTISSGSLNATCVGLPMPIQQKLDGAGQAITKNMDGSISLAILTGCSITLDVNGSAATLRATNPPQMCMFPFMAMGLTLQVTGTFTAANFTINGNTANFSYMGNATTQGLPLMCTVSGMGMATKGAPPDAGATPAADGAAPTADTAAPAADTAASTSDGSTTDGP